MSKKNNFYKKANFILNIQELECPKTIMMIKKITFNMKKNEILLIITNDKLVNLDIEYFCYFMKYSIIDKKTCKIPYLFLIKKL
ncbi:sulfurtransferase TusA family protein [Enterobacteriaceae endosymbiont of Donacia semicuprea]|uniref:sulfurtransferase TusA family protein n=1 Tax=Enterobacteriaceae endosymbiont of Donacia semicuprea TaxID=2675783 RepID=UPI0014496439|nr:sulfurtransferase TusA family protein [Enterobacteriaceae endosymbiont of Donacia semicuprea]QJC32724.1 sulfurtransferase TusA [Enterobacteriaceae endosymbiont of Donacia semicuprea]